MLEPPDPYPPALQAWVARQLRRLPPDKLARLVVYYRTQGDPNMWPLLDAECRLRLTVTSQYPAK